MKNIDKVKLLLRESDFPTFSDQEIRGYLSLYDTFEEALYRMAIIKSENEDIKIDGLEAKGSQNYFKRLALSYRPNKSRFL